MAAAVAAASVSVTILQIPLQVPDCLVPMLQVLEARSAWSMFVGSLGDPAYFRPGYWAQSKLLFDAAHGHYFAIYKTAHILLIGALMLCVVSIARVRSRIDLVAFLFALTVLIGIHTFSGLVREAYPINHYLEAAVATTMSYRLALSRGGWKSDTAAIALFVIAALTIESGLLVWVALAAAWLVGLRGVSTRGVAAVTALLVAYFLVRSVYFQVGMPTLWERSTGFGFSRLDPAAIAQSFEHSLPLLYAYNVGTSILSVLLSEPRSGTWEVTSRLMRDGLQPATLASLVSALVGTGLVIWFAAARWTRWRAGEFERDDRLVIVFVAVLAGNAAMCCVYTKDEIMSTAGVFYALAVYAATRACLLRGLTLSAHRAVAAAALVGVLAAGSTAWCVRATGLFYDTYWKASKVRYEWAEVETFLRDQGIPLRSAAEVRLVEQLRMEALNGPLLNTRLLPHWAKRWFA